MPQNFEVFFKTIRLLDVIDIIVVSIVLYRIYILLKDTRAASLAKGMIVIALAAVLSNWLELHVINWLLQKSITVLLVALPVVFQPELRRALEHLGRGKFFAKYSLDKTQAENMLDEIAAALLNMAKHKIGALIVVEGSTGLKDYIETGTKVDALLSSELLINIFIPNTPLHDGAAIISADRIAAVACLLPLTEKHGLARELGTRHRAAIGLSEVSDALVFVVSEETGNISLANSGNLKRGLTGSDIKNYLRPLLFNGNSKNPLTDSLKTTFKGWRRNKNE